MGVLMPVRSLGPADGRSYFGCGYVDYIAPTGDLGKVARRANVMLPALDEIADAEPITAWLVRNSWRAVCPDCAEGDQPVDVQFVWLDQPLYLCAACWNQAVGGVYRRVVLPAEAAEIEAVTAARPQLDTRNWRPGEAIHELEAENVMRGLMARRGG